MSGNIGHRTIVAPNPPYEEHLKYVTEQMKQLGPPQIRSIWCKEQQVWFAAEGSHRIATAHLNGITPVIIDITGMSANVQREEVDTLMTYEELRVWLTSDPTAPRYIFDNVLIFAGRRGGLIDEKWIGNCQKKTRGNESGRIKDRALRSN
jgi:hypothetical protein